MKQDNLAYSYNLGCFFPNYTVYAAKSAFGVYAMEIKLLALYNVHSSRKNTQEKTREAKQMTKIKSMYYSLAAFSAVLLNAVMLICANTNSCVMIHQPKAPEALSKFSKIE